ncbi:hypothetical protein N4T20_02670 [Flavobacterium sp. TR2]|uniref:hypothetical protein n=1 Tax=Flavobacterium sp. TR2 TaxID=2977321 RepID=UPI0021B1470F|nr:hypothetical protein [Flavobacterium sp. TR2]UWY28835.1 hypothetical protein N4T20_02670 [Flavobacterium sp. TR2]
MKTVIQKLEITEDQHEAIIWTFYSNWCGHITNDLKEFQQVLASTPINAWFRMELTKCEEKFHEMTDRYTNSNVTARDYERCYHNCLITLFSIRPAALLNKIKKTESRPKGIRVFSVN